MKPRIILIGGIWYCGVVVKLGEKGTRTGLGYTPKEAFDDWGAKQ